MAFLFWLLWAFDLLSLLFVLFAKGFRSGNNLSTDLHVWVALGLVLCLAGGPVLRWVFRKPLISLIIVALPAVAALVSYLVDTVFKKHV